jgi:hypothetical protein
LFELFKIWLKPFSLQLSCTRLDEIMTQRQ